MYNIVSVKIVLFLYEPSYRCTAIIFISSLYINICTYTHAYICDHGLPKERNKTRFLIFSSNFPNGLKVSLRQFLE